MRTWAYIAASIGLIIGLLLILRPKDKKWKHGLWFVTIALAVFFGGNLNIGNLFPVSGSFNYSHQIQSLSNHVAELTASIHVQQAQSQSQSVFITNIVNNITLVSNHVSREVADVKLLVSDLYSRTRIERFSFNDPQRSVRLRDQANPKRFMITLQLQYVPVTNSITVYMLSKNGVTSLPPPFTTCQHLLMLGMGENSTEFNDVTFAVSYVIDPFSDEKVKPWKAEY
ncbi:MAG: hypothetical protein PHR35_12470 [Kiritimatiellae bacterium]|nr:hypothetical protein [Kiritimatiellia bacterium]